MLLLLLLLLLLLFTTYHSVYAWVCQEALIVVFYDWSFAYIFVLMLGPNACSAWDFRGSPQFLQATVRKTGLPHVRLRRLPSKPSPFVH